MRVQRLLLAMPLLCAACIGCSRVTDDMAQQPRTNPNAASQMFADGQAARVPVVGTVARGSGDLAWISSGRLATRPEPETVTAPVNAAARVLGQARYNIYCLPCHGAHGDGDGEVVKRGFPAPAPFGSTSLRATTDGRLHDAILNGTGVMYPFADRVSASEAWAIVGYIRTMQRDTPLQTSQVAASGSAAR